MCGDFHLGLLEDFLAKRVSSRVSHWNGDGSFQQDNICILRFCPFNSNARCFIYYSWSTPTATKLEFSNKDTVMHDFRKYSYPYKGQKRTENSPFYSGFSCNKELVWGNHCRNWWRVCYNLYFYNRSCEKSASQSSIVFCNFVFHRRKEKQDISKSHFYFFPIFKKQNLIHDK